MTFCLFLFYPFAHSMKLNDFKYQNLISNFSLKKTWKELGVLLLCLVLTVGAVYYTKINVQNAAIHDFEFICNDLRIKLDTRLKAHAQLLRSSAAFFTVSDTVLVLDFPNIGCSVVYVCSNGLNLVLVKDTCFVVLSDSLLTSFV